MSWLDRLRPGSFRGASFFTLSSELEGGHRGIVHEYPGGKLHTTQTLGPAVKNFTLTVFCVGPDYDKARDNLIAALDVGGKGKLVHRYFGSFDAEVEPGKKYKVTESQDDGGRATFHIPFIRAGAAKSVTVRVDGPALVLKAAGKAKTAASASFLSKLLDARDEVVDAIASANSAVAAVNRTVTGVLAITSGVAGQIQNLGNNVAILVSTPSRYDELAAGIVGIQEALFEAISVVGDGLKENNTTFAGGEAAAAAQSEARKVGNVLKGASSQMLATVGTSDPYVEETTEEGARVAGNQRTVANLYRQSSIAEAVIASMSLVFDSYESAVAMRDQLEQQLLQVAEESDDDDVYATLRDLRAEVSRYMSTAAGSLPRIVNYTPAITLPALVIAHRIYGDATRSEEIVSRNNIRHPGFVPGGYPLRVLTDA